MTAFFKSRKNSIVLGLIAFAGLAFGCGAETTPTVSSVQSDVPTIAGIQNPQLGPVTLYYDGLEADQQDSLLINSKDAAILFAALALQTGNDPVPTVAILDFVNNTLGFGAFPDLVIDVVDVEGLSQFLRAGLDMGMGVPDSQDVEDIFGSNLNPQGNDVLTSAISDFSGDGMVDEVDAAVLLGAVVTGSRQASQIVPFVQTVTGVNLNADDLQAQLDALLGVFIPEEEVVEENPVFAAEANCQISGVGGTILVSPAIENPQPFNIGNRSLIPVPGSDPTAFTPSVIFPPQSVNLTAGQPLEILGLQPGSMVMPGANTDCSFAEVE